MKIAKVGKPERQDEGGDLLPMVDAHHHLWQLDALEYGWLRARGTPKPFGDPTPIQRDYLLDEYRHDCAVMNVCKSVHVQADGALPDPVAETAWLQGIADQYGFPHGIIGFADLLQDDLAETLARHCCYPNFRGIRQIVSRHPDTRLSFCQRDLLAEDKWRANFSLLGELGLSFELQLYPHQMAQAAHFLAHYPKIPVVISHAGSPWDQSEEGICAWREGLSLLASLDQVYIKVSGLGMFDHALHEERVGLIIRTILELFGSQRMMLGSNFPVDSLYADYSSVIGLYRQQLSTLSRAEQVAILSTNAERFYRI